MFVCALAILTVDDFVTVLAGALVAAVVVVDVTVALVEDDGVVVVADLVVVVVVNLPEHDSVVVYGEYLPENSALDDEGEMDLYREPVIVVYNTVNSQ